MGNVRVKEILTFEEEKNIEFFREQINQSRTPFNMVINWWKAKKILKSAEKRYYKRAIQRPTRELNI